MRYNLKKKIELNNYMKCFIYKSWIYKKLIFLSMFEQDFFFKMFDVAENMFSYDAKNNEIGQNWLGLGFPLVER